MATSRPCGTVYAIEGTGTVSKSGTPALDVSAASISTGNTKVAVNGQDNIYLSDGSGINIVDSTTGYLRRPIGHGYPLHGGREQRRWLSCEPRPDVDFSIQRWNGDRRRQSRQCISG